MYVHERSLCKIMQFIMTSNVPWLKVPSIVEKRQMQYRIDTKKEHRKDSSYLLHAHFKHLESEMD